MYKHLNRPFPTYKLLNLEDEVVVVVAALSGKNFPIIVDRELERSI